MLFQMLSSYFVYTFAVHICLSLVEENEEEEAEEEKETIRYQISPDTRTVTHHMHLIKYEKNRKEKYDGNEYEIRIIKKNMVY